MYHRYYVLFTDFSALICSTVLLVAGIVGFVIIAAVFGILGATISDKASSGIVIILGPLAVIAAAIFGFIKPDVMKQHIQCCKQSCGCCKQCCGC